MKKINQIMLLCLMILLLNSTNAQNCKFKKNEYDPALKLQIKTTEREMLTNKSSSSADDNLLGFLIHKANDDVWLLLGLTTFRDYKEDFSTITQGMKAYVYFTNGETTELIVAEDTKSKLYDSKHFGKYQYMYNIYYSFPKSVYQKFQGMPISKIKIEALNSSGQKTIIETIIKEKYNLNISKLINCIQ
jgi:hypothetical protein